MAGRHYDIRELAAAGRVLRLYTQRLVDGQYSSTVARDNNVEYEPSNSLTIALPMPPLAPVTNA